MVWISGLFVFRQWIFGQRIHHDRYGLLQLRIMPLTYCRWIEVDVIIRRDAVAFDLPVTVEPVNGAARCGHAAAVDEVRVAPYADQPSPSLLADQRTDSRFAEVP